MCLSFVASYYFNLLVAYANCQLFLLQNFSIGQSFCGDYNFNQPISSDDVNIHASYAAVLENLVAVSLKAKYVNNMPVVLAGTSSGQLLKVNANIVCEFLIQKLVLAV